MNKAQNKQRAQSKHRKNTGEKGTWRKLRKPREEKMQITKGEQGKQKEKIIKRDQIEQRGKKKTKRTKK